MTDQLKVWQFIALMEKKRHALGYLSHTDEYVIANLKMTPREMTLEDHKEVFSAIRRYIAILDHTIAKMAAWSWFTSEKKNRIIL